MWVIKQLRHRADLPNAKAGKAIASVSIQEIQTAFAGMLFVPDINEIARLLKDE